MIAAVEAPTEPGRAPPGMQKVPTRGIPAGAFAVGASGLLHGGALGGLGGQSAEDWLPEGSELSLPPGWRSRGCLGGGRTLEGLDLGVQGFGGSTLGQGDQIVVRSQLWRLAHVVSVTGEEGHHVVAGLPPAAFPAGDEFSSMAAVASAGTQRMPAPPADAREGDWYAVGPTETVILEDGIDLDEGSSTTAPLRGDEMTAQPLLNPISIGLCNARRTTHVIEKFTTEPSPCAVATVAVDTSISVHDTRTIGRTP